MRYKTGFYILTCVSLFFFFASSVKAQNNTKPSPPINLRFGSSGPSGGIKDGKIETISSTQIAISYTAPSAGACTVEVSEQPGYSPLSADIDPILYPGANSDLGRFQTLQSGLKRKFVVGTRMFQRATNSRVYSRALAAATLHYIRIKCGSNVFETTASTETVPFGSTYADPPQPSDSIAGELLTPTLHDLGRGGSFIDPSTGAKIYRVSRNGDLDFSSSVFNVSMLAVHASTNWTNPDNILTADSSNATYSGASCGETCDWIRLFRTNVWYDGASVDYIRLKLVGSGNQANTADRTIEWGLGLAVSGSCTSSPLDGTTRTLVLPQTTAGQVDADIDYSLLRPATALRGWTRSDVVNAGGFCILIRKATSTGTISLDHAKFDAGVSGMQSLGSGNNYKRASTVKDQNGFLMMNTQTGGARAVVYKIKMEPEPDIRYLGMIQNLGGQCSVIGYSSFLPNRFYCTPSSSPRILQIDYTGNSVNKAAPHTLEISATELTANMNTEVKNFVDANIARYPFAFDSTKFNCTFNGIVQAHGEDEVLQLYCRRGIQNSYAWVAVYQVGAGIIGAYPTWTHKTSRWCGHHSHEEIGEYGGLYLWTAHFLGGGTAGLGPYRTTLIGAISNSSTTITLAGQPTSPVADTTLMDFAVGDTILIDNELMIITSVANFPIIGVQRAVLGSLAASHNNGAIVNAECASDPNGTAYQKGATSPLWDPFLDPYGDGNGITNKAYRGHETIRPGLAVNTNDFSLSTLQIGQDLPYPYRVFRQPPFAGRIPPAAGNSYQTHPTKHTIIGTPFANRVFADTKPFIGGNLFSGPFVGCNPALLLPTPGGCPAQRVSGTSNTYKYTFSGSVRPQATLPYRQMPVFAVSGYRDLKNISGPGSIISDETPYTFCVALLAGECRPGSISGDMFLSAPGVTSYGCAGGESFSGGTDLCIMERAASTLSLSEHSTSIPGVDIYSSRDLALLNSIAPYSRFSSGAIIEHLADGTGLMYANFLRERYDVFIVKVPPYEGAVDSVNRQNFIEFPVQTQQVPSGGARLMVKFGYDTNFNCSPNRTEPCYATTNSINLASPFLWESELTPGDGLNVSGGCASGCTIKIPALSNKVGYYQVIFRNSSGATISASSIEVFSR